MHRLLRLAIAAVALTAFVAAQLLPASVLPEDPPGTDKQWHAALYFGYALVLWWLLPAPPGVRTLVILVTGLIIGVLMELFQEYVPGRSPDKADAIADMVGLAAACAAMLVGSLTRGDEPPTRTL